MSLKNFSVALEEVYKAFFALIDLYFDGDLFTIMREMLNELQVRYHISNCIKTSIYVIKFTGYGQRASFELYALLLSQSIA